MALPQPPISLHFHFVIGWSIPEQQDRQVQLEEQELLLTLAQQVPQDLQVLQGLSEQLDPRDQPALLETDSSIALLEGLEGGPLPLRPMRTVSTLRMETI